MLVAGTAAAGLLLAACGDADGEADGGEPAATETPETSEEPAEEPEGEAGGDEEAPSTDEIDVDALEEVTITWPGGVGPDHWSSAGVSSWAEAIEERSGGKITFDIHWSGSLGPLQEHSVMLRDGISDISEVYIAYEESTFPAANWISNLAWYHDNRPVVGDLQSYGAAIEWGFEDAAVAEWEELGLMPLIPNIQALPTYGLICVEPMTTLEDVQGVSARVPGAVVGSEAETVGFSPTQIPGPEAYESLQRGVIDCTIAHPRDITAFGYGDVAPHVTLGSDAGFSGFMGQGIYTSVDFWESLQPEARQIIWEAIPVFVEEQLRSALEEDAVALAETETISEYDSEFEQALLDHQQALLEGMVDSAPDGVDDPAGAVERFEEIYASWLGDVEALGYDDWAPSWEEHGVRLDEEGVPDLSSWTELFVERVLEPNRPPM